MSTHRRWLANAFALLASLSATMMAWAAPHHAHAPAEAMGTHGMLLFGGRDGLFASHLPMFHPPHDAQVVLRIEFDDATLEARLRETLAGTPAVWTLVPERFDLNRLAPDAAAPLREFRADVVEGHFERGGTPRHHEVTVRVVEVPMFRSLAPEARTADRVEYQRIAAHPDADEQFLVLRIAARPGADHVLALRRGRRDVPELVGLVTDHDDGLSASIEAIRTALTARDATLRGEIYRETGDLR